ncbi:MAG: cytochrome-c oxidase, cbb3-type subunit III [Ahrensia sp.]|nr:cytochrome-c oxidase, cbb3-type subunit III [Ahrensia sp.]
MADKDIDEATGIKTTGHEWDGIQELDNPMPRWWLWTFYATIVFAFGYMIWYPAIPLWNESTMGISGQTNRLQLKADMQEVETARRDIIATLAEQDLEDIRQNQDLVRFASAGGESLFKVYCSQCHGTGAQGGPGYPNLNDDDWLWGGDLEAVYTTIAHGVRNDEDDDARISQMPAFGADGILDRAQINAVSEYVLKLSNQDHDAALAETGAGIFAEQCTACHGENGRGIRDLGAPNLSDAISLYGNTRETIRDQIRQPRHGAMPPWVNRLGAASIKQLAIYVHSLGGGEEAPSE